jgi:hypothetical protein
MQGVGAAWPVPERVVQVKHWCCAMQENWRQASTGAGAAWFRRCRSSHAGEPMQVLERLEHGRRRASGVIMRAVARGSWRCGQVLSGRSRAGPWARADGAEVRRAEQQHAQEELRWKVVARDAGMRWPYRGAAQVFDEMLIRAVLENARVLLLGEASRVQDAVGWMLRRCAGQRCAGTARQGRGECGSNR